LGNDVAPRFVPAKGFVGRLSLKVNTVKPVCNVTITVKRYAADGTQQGLGQKASSGLIL